MSSGYQCEFAEGAPHSATWLHTNLTTGATVALCDEHNGPGMIPLVASELGVDPMGLYGAIEAYLKKTAKQAERDIQAAQQAEAAAAAPAEPDGPALAHLADDDNQADIDRAQAEGEIRAAVEP